MIRKREEIPSLTGLRGVAALCILIGHYIHFSMPIPLDKTPLEFSKLFDLTSQGMTTFFVLSGFVIAYNYSNFDWHNRPFFSLFKFISYRIARLFPLMLVFIIFIIWTRANVLNLQAMDQDKDLFFRQVTDIIRSMAMTQSWFPYLSANGDFVVGGNFFFAWSISTEFFLYFTFAAMMLIGCKIFNGGFSLKLLIAYVIFAYTVFFFWDKYGFNIWHPEMDDYKYHRWLYEASPYYRAFEFGFGMLGCWVYLWLQQSSNHKYVKYSRYGSIIGVVLILSVYLYCYFMKKNAFELSLLSAFGIFLILQGCNHNNLVNKLLSGRFILFVGTISYSLYLFHFLPPNFASWGGAGMDAFGGFTLAIFAINFSFAVLFAFAMAYGLYNLVEVPGRRFVRNIFRKYVE